MPATKEISAKPHRFSLPDVGGHFGPYGGVFVPETLMTALAGMGVALLRWREDRR